MTDDLITQIIGVPTPFLRPPYGAYNDRVLAATGVPIIFWSVDPLDWRDRDAEVVAARIIISPVGAIILAHDIHRTTVAAVPAIIAALKGRGIHFVTVAKLFEPQTLLPENVYINQPDSPSRIGCQQVGLRQIGFGGDSALGAPASRVVASFVDELNCKCQDTYPPESQMEIRHGQQTQCNRMYLRPAAGV